MTELKIGSHEHTKAVLRTMENDYKARIAELERARDEARKACDLLRESLQKADVMAADLRQAINADIAMVDNSMSTALLYGAAAQTHIRAAVEGE